MKTSQRRSRELESQPVRTRLDRVRASTSKRRSERPMIHITTGDEPIAIGNDATAPSSRLDEVLARHQRRRSRALALLLLWAVFGGALLAL